MLSGVCVCALKQETKANYTSPVARFAVAHLYPSTVYSLTLYAFNTKGRSEPTHLQATMLRLPEKQLNYETGK